MPPRLVVVCETPHGPSMGPTGYNGSWQGELAVQLDDGSVCEVGTKLWDQSVADYSSNSRSWMSVELQSVPGGWLITVIPRWMEMAFGEGEHAHEHWIAASDAKQWRKLGPSDGIPAGTRIDAIETPATDRTIAVAR